MPQWRPQSYAFAAVFVAGAIAGSLVTYWLLADSESVGAVIAGRSEGPTPVLVPAAVGPEAQRSAEAAPATSAPSPVTRQSPPSAAVAGVIRGPATLSLGDPGAAFDLALAAASRIERESSLQRIVQVWVGDDPLAAMARIEQLDDSSLRWQLASIALQAWSQRDARAAWNYALSLDEAELAGLSPERPIQRGGGIDFIAMQLARQDPAAALEASTRLDGQVRQQVRRVALLALASQDPQGALRYTDILENYEERNVFLQSVASNWASQDVVGALAWAKALDPPNQGLELTIIINAAAAMDSGRALSLALAASPAQRDQAVSSVISITTRTASDVPALAGTVMAIEDASLRQRGLASLASAWASRDPQAAMQWFVDNAANVPPGTFRDLAQAAARIDVAAVAAYADRMPNAVRRDWLQEAARQYAKIDPAGGVAWIRQWRDRPEYQQLLTSAIPSLARIDPDAAVRLLNESDLPGPAELSAYQSVASQWAQVDPGRAAQWATGIDNDRLRPILVQRVASVWGGQDTDAALRWVQTLPADDTRDAALGTLLTTSARYRPVDDNLLASFLSDAARQQTLVNTLTTIYARDPLEARGLVDRYISDPELNRRAQQILTDGGGFSVF